MPNHVTNIIFAEPKVLDAIRDKKGIVDLFKLLPLPNSLKVEPFANGIPFAAPERLLDDIKRAKKDGREEHAAALTALSNNLDACGYSNPLEWARTVMGTKWGGYNHDVSRSSKDLLVFDTAWATPIEALIELSADHPDKPILVHYADEDIGSNVGAYILIGGNVAYMANDSNQDSTTTPRWSDRAIEIKGIDKNDEDFVENYRTVRVHHNIFLGEQPIVKLTPQFKKLFNTEERQTILYAIIEQFLSEADTYYFEYTNGNLSISTRNCTHFKESRFIELHDITMFEFDETVIKSIFDDLSTGFGYYTEIPFNSLLAYVDTEIADLLTCVITAGTFLQTRYRVFTYLKTTVSDYESSIKWMADNRDVKCDIALDALEQYLRGEVSYKEWTEKADMPRQSLIPEHITRNTDAHILPTGHHVFKNIARLYSYRDIITDVGDVVTYTNPVNGNTYTFPYEKFPLDKIGMGQ